MAFQASLFTGVSPVELGNPGLPQRVLMSSLAPVMSSDSALAGTSVVQEFPIVVDVPEGPHILNPKISF